jgi:hypothetical protein
MLHLRLQEASRFATRSRITGTVGMVLLAAVSACTRQDFPSKTSAASAAPAAAPDTAGTTSSTSARIGSAKPQSAEECRQSCNGEWSAHGITGVVSCLCRTSDAGRDCRDKSECQGECLLTPVRTEQVSAGPPATGYFVGKCAEFVTSFGCSRRIQAGAKSAGPVDLSQPPPEICQD